MEVKQSSKRAKVYLLAGVFLITTRGFSEDGRQFPVGATLAVAGEQPEASNTLPVARAAPSRPKTSTEQPAGITYGFSERFRFEGQNNADFNGAKHDELSQLRFETKIYANISLGPALDAYVRLANETVKRTVDPKTAHEVASPVMAGDAWFDAAYLDFKRFPGLTGLSLKVGRFDIVKGDGFVFSDPSGLDGSRANYNNAFDLKYRHGRWAIELIGVDDPKYDSFLPVINPFPSTNTAFPANSGTIAGATRGVHSGKQLEDWDQAAIGAYYTNRSSLYTDIDAYYFFKKDYADLRSQANYLYMPDRHFSMIGGRIVRRFPRVPGLSLTGEFNYELGTEDSMKAGLPKLDIRAWGGYGYAKKQFNVRSKPWVSAGFWALSGQDPRSKAVGNYEQLFGFWPSCPGYPGAVPDMETPAWSDLYIQSLAPETSAAVWTNLKMVNTEAGFTPVKPITLLAGYSFLGSWHPFAMNPYHTFVNPVSLPAAQRTFFDNGTGRGQQIKGRVVYTFNKSTKGFFFLEKIYPGDFYKVRNNGYFYRFELLYTYKGFLPFHRQKA